MNAVATKKIYTCGSLQYTRFGVVMLFFWVLWGDFCLVLLENIRPVIVPLILREHKASNFLIGLLCGSIPPLLNFIVNPIISTASDRARTRWGRRIPFLMAGVPFVSLFLILLGFSDQIGTFIAHNVVGNDAAVAPIVITMLAIFSVGFCFFDLFAGCVYYYLFADVVPKELMGRFMGFFRLAGSCGGMIFSFVVMDYVKTHMAIVCVLTAVVYIVGFGGMCLNVKEGEYPPPPEAAGAKTLDKIKGYFKECFSIPFWQIFYIGMAMNQVSTLCRQVFNILYGTEYLALTTGQYGKIMGSGSILIMCLAIPVGYIVDKLHPWRTFLAGGWLVIVTNALAFYFCDNFVTFYITSLTLTLVYLMQQSSALPLVIALFPKQQFGQFSSANAMIKAICMVVFNAIGGWFIDLLGYQYLFVWDFAFTLASMLMLMWVYNRWKKMGGKEGYVPPTIANRTA